MITRSWTPLAAAAIVAAGCIWAGIWQLDRLAERKARNATTEAAFRAEPVPVDLVMGDSARRFRRVMARGQWSYAGEIVVPGRSRHGSPGVHIVTPMTLDEGGTSILVNRGWVYSPDARSVDLARWHEGDQGEVIGYVDVLPLALRRTQASLYVVALADSAAAPPTDATRPARLSAPPFGEQGPHLGYAVQWFSFAAIALIGAPILVRRQRGRRD
jgi:surfeit locus 1 family protein